MSSKVGPEWANSLTRVRILMKKYEILNAMAATAAFSKKEPVAATALTAFYFFDPSSVLSPIWTPKLIFREVNYHSRSRRLKSHLPT